MMFRVTTLIQRNCTYLYLYNVRDIKFCLMLYVTIEQHGLLRVLISQNRIQRIPHDFVLSLRGHVV